NAVMSMKADGAALSGEKTAAAKGHSASMGKGFIEAQLVWDRAFAEAIHGAMDRRPGHSVIAFMGRGHVEYNHGVVHQLADLGVFNTATAIAVFPGPDCSVDADADGRPIADLVYGLPEPFVEHVPKPRIGVFIKQAEGGGAEITRISPDSPAERAGFMAGDIVTEAAGHPMKRASDLGTAIRRHTWGAWLPFTVKRGDETLELVAKLPTAPPS
ncbi:MAG: ChaN family lipoprotein, partial [Alphaproteobacteria bacterium]